jgi:inosose dehydratase
MASMKARFKRENVRIGITPTGWWNDDFLDITAGIPYEQVFSEMALAGYDGCSYSGNYYPKDNEVLKRELRLRGLRISEPWTSTYFTIPEGYDRTIEDFHDSLALIKDMGGTDLVVAELGSTSHELPIALVPNRPIFTDAQWEKLASGLNELGRIANAQGMRVCYHHHMGTGVMTRADVDRLMKTTDPKLVHLLVDTGHITFAGDDALAMVKAYAHRIKHVHLKNVRLPVVEDALARKLSFKEAILEGVFTVPGDSGGHIDFPPILEALAEADFEGWLVVEAEQDPKKWCPLSYAMMARRYLREVIGF